MWWDRGGAFDGVRKREGEAGLGFEALRDVGQAGR